MRRTRLLVVAALATASLGIAAPPASACPNEDQPPCACENANDFFERWTGQRPLNCL